MFDRRAQGTIEYLVILGVVVVISLVVVGVIMTQTGGGTQVASNSSKIANMTSGISVADAVVGLDGNGLLLLQNNTGETIRINYLSINGANTSAYEYSLPIGSKGLFDLNGLGGACGCSSVNEQRNCNVVIHYLSVDGLEKQMSYSLPIDCVQNITPKNPEKVIYAMGGLYVPPVVDNTPPIVSVTSPANHFSTESASINFVFNASDAGSGLAKCWLRINSNYVAFSTSLQNGSNTISYTLPTYGVYVWDINCMDNNGNSIITTAHWDVNYHPISTTYYSVYQFNGSSGDGLSINQVVESPTGSWTLEFWFKANGGNRYPSDQPPTYWCSTTNYYCEMHGYLIAMYGLLQYWFGRPVYFQNDWHHIAWVADSGSGRVRLYIDGELKQTDGYFSGGYGYSSSGLGPTINFMVTGYNENQEFWMTNIKYSRVAEYSSNFVPSFPLSANSNTIFFFPLTEGSGSTVSSRVNDYTATINSNISWKTDVPAIQ